MEPTIDVNTFVAFIKDEISSNYAPLNNVFGTCMARVSAEFFTVGIISDEVKRNPSTDAILQSFYAEFAFMKTISEVQTHCRKFFSIFYKIGGPFIIAGNSLKQDIVKSVGMKLNFNASL